MAGSAVTVGSGATACTAGTTGAAGSHLQCWLQIGRAGRDGSEAFCHLFLDDADFVRLRSLAHSDGIDQPSVAAFLEAVFDCR